MDFFLRKVAVKCKTSMRQKSVCHPDLICTFWKPTNKQCTHTMKVFNEMHLTEQSEVTFLSKCSEMSSPLYGLISWNLHWMWWLKESRAQHPGYGPWEHIPAMTNAALVDTNWIILTQRHWAGWGKDHWRVFWCPSFMLRDNDNSKGETEVSIYHLVQRVINQHFCFAFVYLHACMRRIILKSDEGGRERFISIWIWLMDRSKFLWLCLLW